ncbi:MAG: hypothetical protein K6A32_00405 [Bacteroidales bacterium]|nr:hypothetical protein [Bacteroidales bacterium]
MKGIQSVFDKGKHGRRSLWTAFCVALWMCVCFTACDDYDSFTTDRSATLQFSSDTVRFDTLIATIPSSTRTLTVYNRGDEGLRISEIWLEKGAESVFRINIDGQDMSRSADNRVTDFEVRRRDSIVVRIEVTIPELESDSVCACLDLLHFRLESGVGQTVHLVASGRNAFFMKGISLTADTTFTAQRPIVVYDSLVVSPDVTLTLEAGTQLLFHEKAGIIVHGTLKALGSLEEPVVMRGDRTDHMFDYLPYDRLPSRWEGLVFTRESLGNFLEYLDLHSGLFGIRCDSTGTESLKMKLVNARIHNLGGHGLELLHCRVEVGNTEVSNTLGHCAYVVGGDVQFTHCTLAQFYPLSANRGHAVNIVNQDSLGYFPLYRADFINCVATGYAEDVLMIPSLNREEMPTDAAEFPINYQFINCFLTTVVPEDELYTERFVSCSIDSLEAEINREKHFQLIDAHNFLYDFTPIEDSPIRGIADSTYSVLYPLDRLGRLRIEPDAGCYETTVLEKEE